MSDPVPDVLRLILENCSFRALNTFSLISRNFALVFRNVLPYLVKKFSFEHHSISMHGEVIYNLFPNGTRHGKYEEIIQGNINKKIYSFGKCVESYHYYQKNSMVTHIYKKGDYCCEWTYEGSSLTHVIERDGNKFVHYNLAEKTLISSIEIALHYKIRYKEEYVRNL